MSWRPVSSETGRHCVQGHERMSDELARAAHGFAGVAVTGVAAVGVGALRSTALSAESSD